MSKKRKSVAVPVVAFAAITVGALLLYVLSLGPAYWLITHGYLADGIYFTVYAPLFWLYERSSWCRFLLDHYTALWKP